MASPGVAQQAKGPRVTALHVSALTIVVLAGACAMVALVAGSPLEFGGALAVSGAGWIAADFIEWMVEDEHCDSRCAIPAAGSPHVVLNGSGKCSSRQMRPPGIHPAAMHLHASVPTIRQIA